MVSGWPSWREGEVTKLGFLDTNNYSQCRTDGLDSNAIVKKYKDRNFLR